MTLIGRYAIAIKAQHPARENRSVQVVALRDQERLVYFKHVLCPVKGRVGVKAGIIDEYFGGVKIAGHAIPFHDLQFVVACTAVITGKQ